MVSIGEAVGNAIQTVINWFATKLSEGFKPLVEPIIQMILNTPVPKREVDGTVSPAIFNKPTNNLFPEVYNSYYDAVVAVLFLGMVAFMAYSMFSMIGLTDSNTGLKSKSNWFKLLFAVILGYPFLMVGLHFFNILTHLFASGETVDTISSIVGTAFVAGVGFSAMGGAPIAMIAGGISTFAVVAALAFLVFHSMYLMFFPMFAPYFMLFYFGEIPVLKKVSKVAFTLWVILGVSKPLMAGLLSITTTFIDGAGSAIFSGQIAEGLLALLVALTIPLIPIVVPTALIWGVISMASGGGAQGAMKGARLGSRSPPAMASRGGSGGGFGSGSLGVGAATSSGPRPGSIGATRSGHALRSGAATVKEAAGKAPGKIKDNLPSVSTGSPSQIAGQQASLPEFNLPSREQMSLPTEGSKDKLKQVVPYGEAAASMGSKGKELGGKAKGVASSATERALNTAPDAKWSLQNRSQFQDSLDTINEHGIDSDAGQEALDTVTEIMEDLPEGGETKFAPDQDEMLAQISTGGAKSTDINWNNDTENTMTKVMDELESRSQKISFNNSKYNSIREGEDTMGMTNGN